jgi:LacI family transcriptional regulator
MGTDASDSLGDGRFDGLIWCKFVSNPENLQALETATVPIVILHAPPPAVNATAAYVSCDNEQGLRLAVDHLIGLGHRKIAFAYTTDNERNDETQSRMRGFQAAMIANGLACDPSRDLLAWNDSCDDLAEWAQNDDRHTAIVCWSESQAVNLLARAKDTGLSVPDDLSVVGFDSTAICDTTTPPLTAIRQPIEEMASQATKLLISSIEAQTSTSQHFIYPCALDIRGSTACPSQSRGY